MRHPGRDGYLGDSILSDDLMIGPSGDLKKHASALFTSPDHPIARSPDFIHCINSAGLPVSRSILFAVGGWV